MKLLRDIIELRMALTHARAVVKTVPGWRLLLAGIGGLWLITTSLPLRGVALDGLRLGYALLFAVLYFTVTGKVSQMRQDLQRLRVGLACDETWHHPRSRGHSRALHLAGWLLCVTLPAAAHQSIFASVEDGPDMGLSRVRWSDWLWTRGRGVDMSTLRRLLKRALHRQGPVVPTLMGGILIGAIGMALLAQATGHGTPAAGARISAAATPPASSSGGFETAARSESAGLPMPTPVPTLAAIYIAYHADQDQFAHRAILRQHPDGTLSGTMELWRIPDYQFTHPEYNQDPLTGWVHGARVQLTFKYFGRSPAISFTGALQGNMIVGIENGFDVNQDQPTIFCATSRTDRMMC